MTQELIADGPGNNPLVSAHKLSFIETFVGTLLAPIQTFNRLREDCAIEASHLPTALAIVVLVFSLDAVRLSSAKEPGWILVNVPTEVTAGIVLWLLAAGIVSLTGLCFGASAAKARTTFVTFAWSFLPWIFMGPISCLSSLLGKAHVLFMIIPFCWIVFLQIAAIKCSYDMKAWQALILVLLIPPMLSWFQALQFFQGLLAVIGSIF